MTINGKALSETNLFLLILHIVTEKIISLFSNELLF